MSILIVALKYLVLWPMLIVSGAGVLASAFAVIDSIVNFKILAAIGFFLLAVILDKTAFKWIATKINYLS